MNEITVASDRTPAILRAIDEISFHSSLLALNAAVQAVSEAPAQAFWSGDAAGDTLTLIEASIKGAGSEALRGVAERIRHMRCTPAGVSKHPACVAACQKRPFVDAR